MSSATMVTPNKTPITTVNIGERSETIVPPVVNVVVAKPLSNVMNVPKIGIN